MPSRPTPLLSFPASTFLDPPPRQYSPPPPPSRLSRFVSILPLVLILLLQLLFTYTFLGTLVISHLLVDRSEFFRALGYSLVFVILAGGSIGCLLIAYLRGGGAIEVGRPEVMERRIDVEEEERDEDDVPLLNVYNQFRAEERSDRPASYQLKADGSSRRYCKKCCIFKPDRSHHCSHCNRCIKKLDHYCPALGTCIGYANLKSFILFLLYTGIESTFVSVSSGIELNRFINEEGRYGNFEVAPIAWAVQMLFGAIVGLSLLSFGSYHVYLASRNRTTIETMERPSQFSFANTNLPPTSTTVGRPFTRFERRSLERRISKINIYDLGWRRNLRAVFGGGDEGRWDEEAGRLGGRGFGRRWWIFLIPLGSPPGDGLSFKINPEKAQLLEKLSTQLREGVVIEEGRRSESTFSVGDEEEDSDAG